MTVQPFQIDVPQTVLDDLNERLARTRWPDEVEGAGWNYGANLAYMEELADYWRTQYDWRKQEAMLNAFPQFQVEIDGFGLHFIHVKGKGPKPTSLSSWMVGRIRFTAFIKSLTLRTKDGDS